MLPGLNLIYQQSTQATVLTRPSSMAASFQNQAILGFGTPDASHSIVNWSLVGLAIIVSAGCSVTIGARAATNHYSDVDLM